MNIINKILCNDLSDKSNINDVINRLQIGYICSLLSGVFISLYSLIVVVDPAPILRYSFLVLALLFSVFWSRLTVKLFNIFENHVNKTENYDYMYDQVNKYADMAEWLQIAKNKTDKRLAELIKMVGELNEYLLENNIDVSEYTTKKIKSIKGD